jgi:hypothetical protein
MTPNALFSSATHILAGDDCWYLQLESEDFGTPGYLPRVVGPFKRLVDLCLERDRYPNVDTWDTVYDRREVPKGAIRPTQWARNACVTFTEYKKSGCERPVLGFQTEGAARQWLLKYGCPYTVYDVVIGDSGRAFPCSPEEDKLLKRLVAVQLHIENFELVLSLRAQHSGGQLCRCSECTEAYSPPSVASFECPVCRSRKRMLGDEQREELAGLRREFQRVSKLIQTLKAQPGRPTMVVAAVHYEPPAGQG